MILIGCWAGTDGRLAVPSVAVFNHPLRSFEECNVHRLQRVLNRLVNRVDTPVPIVLVDVMQDNIDRMQAFAAQHNLDVRPHVKTHKCVEIGRRQVEAGAVGITAGNVGEAEVFAAAGFDDIFLAYPVWPSGTKGTRIRRLPQTAQLRIGVDNVAAIEALADAMGGEAGPAPDRGRGRLWRSSLWSAARGRG